TLFVQSLAVVFRFRMTEDAQIAGAQWIQHRIYKFIYYPILGIAVATGLYLAMITGAFSNGLWLHYKLVGLLLLIVFGFLNGMQILKRDLPKPMAMFVHIGIFCTSVFMIYMASAKPF
ncbi:MAG: SirB2 family protein, partial [bacterium]